LQLFDRLSAVVLRHHHRPLLFVRLRVGVSGFFAEAWLGVLVLGQASAVDLVVAHIIESCVLGARRVVRHLLLRMLNTARFVVDSSGVEVRHRLSLVCCVGPNGDVLFFH